MTNAKTSSVFVAPTSITVEADGIVIEWVNSATGNDYASKHSFLFKTTPSQRKNMGELISPSNFYGKEGTKQAMVDLGLINPLSDSAILNLEKEQNSKNLTKLFG